MCSDRRIGRCVGKILKMMASHMRLKGLSNLVKNVGIKSEIKVYDEFSSLKTFNQNAELRLVPLKLWTNILLRGMGIGLVFRQSALQG